MGRNVIQFKDKDNNVYDVKDVVARTTKADVIINNTESAPVTSVKDAIGDMPVKTLEVQIDPVQDLHGQENPYPAGGGKNLFNPDSTSTEWVNSSSQITSLTSSKSCRILVSAGEKITLSNNVQASNSFVYLISFIDSSDGVLSRTVATSGYSITATAPANTAMAIVGFSNWSETGTEAQAEKSDTKTDFAPYSNLCHISGWTSADVTQTGKNLLDESIITIVSGKFIEVGASEGGVIKSANGFNYTDEYTKVLQGENYTFAVSKSATTYSRATYVVFYDENKNYMDYLTLAESSTSASDILNTFTIPDEVHYVRFDIPNFTAGTLKFAHGSNVDSTVSGVANVYTYTFPQSAGTVYGGTLTINRDGTGTLIAEYAKKIFDGTDTFSVNANQNRAYVQIGGMASYTGLDDDLTKCDTLKKTGTSSSVPESSPISITIGVSSNYVYLNGIKSQGITNGETLNAWLSDNNVAFTYKLATPVSYDLTAQQVVSLLKGVNNVWADTGNVSLEYPADTKLYIDGKVAELQALILES